MKLSKSQILKKHKIDFDGVCFSYGNKKLPETHLIVNFCSSHHCPSKERNLCRVKGCYALKLEKLRSRYLDKNLAMEKFFKSVVDNLDFSDAIRLIELYVLNSPKKIRCIRLNEAGDFVNQNYITFANMIAEYFKSNYDIETYAWTARSDLDFSGRKFFLNSSTHMIENADNYFFETSKELFDKLPYDAIKCAGDCSSCSICYTWHPQVYTIYCKHH